MDGYCLRTVIYDGGVRHEWVKARRYEAGSAHKDSRGAGYDEFIREALEERAAIYRDSDELEVAAALIEIEDDDN